MFGCVVCVCAVALVISFFIISLIGIVISKMQNFIFELLNSIFS